MKTSFSFSRRVLALASILTAALAAGACEEYGSNSQNHHQGHGGGQGVCYEKVLDVDKNTGQAHYVNRAIPCPK